MTDGGPQVARAAGPPARPAAQQPPKTEPVAIVLPDTITPGVSKVEVDVSDGERLEMLVPEQARPGDRLVFKPESSGAWGCSVLRPGAGADPAAAASEGEAPPGRLRQLEVLVPEGVEVGKKLEVNVEGEILLLSVPECARPGDRLRLSEDPSGNWKCQLEQRQGGSASGSRSCGLRVEGDTLFCLVPPDAKPGETRLRLSKGEAGEHPLVVTVPDNALPGDELALTREDGTWNMRIIREVERDDDAPVSLGPRRNVTLCRINSDPHELFREVVSAARAAGGRCSEKLARGATPPLDALGVIVTAPVEEGEELARMPASLHLSNEMFKERLPELHNAVTALHAHLGSRAPEAAHAACIARVLQDAAARTEGLDALAAERPEPAGGLVEQVWDAYARSILSECWDSHPYWCSIEDPAAVHELMSPSREQEYLAMMAGDVIAMHDRIVEHVSPRILGPNFHSGFFLQARLAILTRVFQLNGDSALVPVNDCFNHSTDAGAIWEWDDERSEQVLLARRAHAAGEQVFISYGRRSNVLLFRTYGFTMPPQIEPNWTYIMTAKGNLLDIYRKYLPAHLAKRPIHFESNIVQDSLVTALNACSERGCSPEAFLREACGHCLEAYESSDKLRPVLEALRRARAKDPRSAAWWAELSEADAPSGPKAEGALAGWEEHALRVQMSEYLCLTAHVEVLDVVAGRLLEEQCLEGAANARSVLKEGFQILRSGGRFSCNFDCSFPLSMIRGLT